MVHEGVDYFMCLPDTTFVADSWTYEAEVGNSWGSMKAPIEILAEFDIEATLPEGSTDWRLTFSMRRTTPN